MLKIEGYFVGWVRGLGDGRDWIIRRAHFFEYLVEPLERSVESQLDPAWTRAHVLTVVIGAPAFHKTQLDHTLRG